MTVNEFSNQFDVLYNNITSNQAPGLNEYEKSVFLTKAQDEIVKNYFNPKSNPKQDGYDSTAKRQIDFSTITSTKNITVTNNDTSFNPLFDLRGNSKSVPLPSDVMMIINERVEVNRGDSAEKLLLTVDAISFDEYDRLMSKPFKRPLHYKAWRLINNNAANKADLVVGPSDTITGYTVRYIRRPHPIIIGDIEGLTIEGYSYGDIAPTDPADTLKCKGCELDPALHEEILQRAVELAKIAWEGSAQSAMTAGARSE